MPNITFIQEFLNRAVGTLPELFIRIFLAGVCGALIGLERTKRQKDAGIRTHLILALGCATLVIASKYGFIDIANSYPGYSEFLKADISRVTSTILSGVGFIGAGVIFIKGGSIIGLTTAAGIWATLASSISIGAGLYEIGMFVTFLTIFSQIVLHKYYPSSDRISCKISIKTKKTEDIARHITNFFNQYNAVIYEFSTKEVDSENMIVNLIINMARQPKIEDIYEGLHKDLETMEISISG